MARLTTGTTNLRKAYKAHLANSSVACPSHYMLKFYATECGLKCVLGSRNYNTSSEDLDQLQYSHDLMDLVRELRLPRRISDAAVSFKTVSGFTYSIGKLHQAWRYGIAVTAESEQQLLKWLSDVCIWIDGEI